MRLLTPVSLAALFTVCSLVGTLAGAGPARAQSEQEATRERLAAAYATQPTLSNACSLAEAERRAGLVDEAARRLDEQLAAVQAEPGLGEEEASATLSACRFNRARIYEDRGDLRAAYRLLSQALMTPNATRRRIVEQRLLDVGVRLVTASGCAALPSRFSSEALLRFGDNAILRRCVTAARRAAPYCTPTAADDIPDPATLYDTRRLDANMGVVQDGQFLVVVTTRGTRVSAFECRFAGQEEQLGLVHYHRLGRVGVLEVTTYSRVGYSCDDCEGGEDCRCADDSETRYFFGERGELLLALIAAGVDEGSMAAWPHDSPELRDTGHVGTTVDGSVLLVNGRRLRLVRGALVPAP